MTDMEKRVRTARNVNIGLQTARYSILALINASPEERASFPFFERELLALQEDVWQLSRAWENQKPTGRARRIETK